MPPSEKVPCTVFTPTKRDYFKEFRKKEFTFCIFDNVLLFNKRLYNNGVK